MYRIVNLSYCKCVSYCNFLGRRCRWFHGSSIGRQCSYRLRTYRLHLLPLPEQVLRQTRQRGSEGRGGEGRCHGQPRRPTKGQGHYSQADHHEGLLRAQFKLCLTAMNTYTDKSYYQGEQHCITIWKHETFSDLQQIYTYLNGTSSF